MRRITMRFLLALGVFLTGVGTMTAPASAATNVTAFANVGGGLCLEISGGTTAYGSQAQQWGCNGGDNQHWIVWHNSNGFLTIVNRASGQCLEVPGGTTTEDGVRVQQWPCNNGRNQYWTFESQRNVNGHSTANIVSASGRCLEISGWNTGTWGAGAQIWGCNGGDNQRWAVDNDFHM
ncbi:RICIN domain-containing protein [Streptomyces melanogenes]|uniref:RICIN domain-containing protein n=1 Tax=Streptomyces melanogenes TaxID=67326 RepID=UPI003792439E